MFLQGALLFWALRGINVGNCIPNPTNHEASLDNSLDETNKWVQKYNRRIFFLFLTPFSYKDILKKGKSLTLQCEVPNSSQKLLPPMKVILLIKIAFNKVPNEITKLSQSSCFFLKFGMQSANGKSCI